MSKIQEEVIIERIKKLLRHSQSAKKIGSEAEADAFAAKVNEMLLEYNIERSKVEGASLEEDKFATWTYTEKLSYKDNQSGNRWKLALIGVLCKYNFCSYTMNERQKHFNLYGQMQNVDTVVWLYNFLSIGFLRIAQENHKALDAETKAHYNRYAFLKDFLNGCVVGLEAKLEAQLRHHQKNNELTGLMIVNKEALGEFIGNKFPNLKKARAAKMIYVGSGYSKGVEVGKNYEVGKPLGGAPHVNKPKQLGS